MADLFDLPLTRSSKGADANLLSKSNKVGTAPISLKSGNLFTKIADITATVERKLGKYRDKCCYFMAEDEDKFKEYIYNIRYTGRCAIDTETTGLNPIKDRMVGCSLFSKGQKWLYVPLHHKSYITMSEIEGQLPSKLVAEQLQTLIDAKVEFEMHNAPFDVRVVKNEMGIYVPCWFDTQLASNCLNENEIHKLKPLHSKYVLNGEEDEWSFGKLFEGITFDLVPIDPGFIYAARDAVDTDELADFQLPFLTPNDPVCVDYDLQDVANVFWNIEMPYVDVIVELEENGVEIDADYAASLSEKYHKLEDEKLQDFYKVLAQYQPQIDEYIRHNRNHGLSNPVSVSSPKQLAVLFYDILKVPVVDKSNPRGTGKDILSKIDNPLCKAITEYRKVSKLLSTYIDAIPNMVCADGRVHCHFNQYGAKTGRLSSDDPNLQNIPSHNKDIRKMFKATDKEYDVTCDSDNIFTVKSWTEVMTVSGWKSAKQLTKGDILKLNNGDCKVDDMKFEGKDVLILCTDFT